LSFIDKKSSGSTSISKVPSVYKSKKSLKNRIDDIKLSELSILGKYNAPPIRKIVKTKNKS
jgi:hypothetical protein